MNFDLDTRVRLAAMQWLEEQTARHGDVLPWKSLLSGLTVDGDRVPLLSQQGIFKPRLCRLPLSIRTSVSGPYQDAFLDEGFLLYRYRGQDPLHHDNAGLREAMRLQAPLIYLHGHVEGRYHAVWPVYIVGDDPGGLTFTVMADDRKSISWGTGIEVAEGANPRRRYITSTVQRRLHQRSFSERVLRAYNEQCALCRLRHRELLDGAHIIADRDPLGEPVVSNGLALCKIHHAAFDQYILTVRERHGITDVFAIG